MSRSGLQLAVRHLGDGPTRKIAAAIFSLLACLLAINGVAAKEFPAVGGAVMPRFAIPVLPINSWSA